MAATPGREMAQLPHPRAQAWFWVDGGWVMDGWGEEGATGPRPPVKTGQLVNWSTGQLVRLEPGGPPIWATSIAHSSVAGPAVGRAGQVALRYGWGRANHEQWPASNTQYNMQEVWALLAGWVSRR